MIDLQMPTPKYTLTYFDARGLGEMIRWTFAVADQPYEDVRIKWAPGQSDEWDKLKPTTPFGQMPVLTTDDGFTLCQSNAILNYLAHQFGLAGKNNNEFARVHMILDCLTDVSKASYPIYMEKDEEKKTELKAKFSDEVKVHMKNLEKFVTDNGHSHFVGNGLTVADIAFTTLVDRLAAIIDPHLDDFPKLKEISENTKNHPKIAAWIAKRPETMF